MQTALVILAAGKGTRMRSDLPKVLHPLASFPLLAHAMTSGASLAPQKTVVVAGHGAEAVTKATATLDPAAKVVIQSEQLGTGHAVAQTRDALKDFSGDILVLYGDTPFVRPDTLRKMKQARESGSDVVVLGFDTPQPGGYGRLILGPDGALDAIVEAKDATTEQKAVTLCNSGVIMAEASLLFDLVDQITDDNAAEEYYLTDIVALANTAGKLCSVVTCPVEETFGINSRRELATAEASFQSAARLAAMDQGVTLTSPETVYFALDTKLGRDITIGPNVFFGPGVTVADGAVIHAFCHIDGAHIGPSALVGPYARLRPGTTLAEKAKIGNFVEIKTADIGIGAKVNHLSYVGDADVGAAANIGAGTIFCNYDGVMKHKTTIGAEAFIGSNSSLVAPVTVGQGAMVGTGSVINQDIPAEALGITRTPQKIIAGFATRLFKKLRAAKARRDQNN